MVKTSQRLAISLVLFVSACSRSIDACPEGMVREGDHCVAEDPVVPGHPDPEPVAPDEGTSPGRGVIYDDEEDDGGGAPDANRSWLSDGGLEGGAATPDASVGIDASPGTDAALGADAASSMDASLASDGSSDDGTTSYDAEPVEAGLDAVAVAEDATADTNPSDASPVQEAEVPADAMQDANDASEPSEAAIDGGESDASTAPICADTDLANWRAFQVSGRLVQTIATCYARDPRCGVGACDLATCLREAAGVTGCVDCVAEETRCALSACVSACGSSDTSDACRACACRQGCIGATAACGMGSVNVCADCNGTTCTNVSLDPALIMVIVDATL